MANDVATDATGVELTHVAEKAIRGAAKRHRAAYEKRAGMVGELLSCICTWPLDVDPTTVTGHDPRCPTDGIKQAHDAVEERRAKEGW